MSNEGPSGGFRIGSGIAMGMKKAQTYGRTLVNGTGPVGVTLKTLGLAEHFGEIKEDLEKLEKLEKRMYERMSLAEEALANAKRSPHLKNVGSVDLLEGTMEDIQEYMDSLGTSGPLLRGASYHEMNPCMEMMLEWITDALVALQVDTMLAVINGDVVGDIPWVAPKGCAPEYGEAPSQAVNPGNQTGDYMRGQHPQSFLIPPQMHPVLPHHWQHQIPPATLRGAGAFATPNGGAGWPNNAQGVPPMMMHHAPPAMACTPIGYDGAGWSNSSDQRDQGAQRPRLPDTNSEVPDKMPRAFGPHMVYDSAGCPFYSDVNTGHHYPVGWGPHP